MIVAALRKGDLRRAVELILEVYQEELFVYCARLVQAADAATTYQRALASALEQLSRFRGETSVRAWLYAIARRAVLDHRQHGSALGGGAADPPEAPVDLPGAAASLQLGDADLEQLLEQLDHPTREVLQLSQWHGLRLAEVAYITGRSELETRELAAGGLSALAQAFRQQAAGDPC